MKTLYYGVVEQASATKATTIFRFTDWDKAVAFSMESKDRGLPFTLPKSWSPT